jgi:hypothetical protein
MRDVIYVYCADISKLLALHQHDANAYRSVLWLLQSWEHHLCARDVLLWCLQTDKSNGIGLTTSWSLYDCNAHAAAAAAVLGQLRNSMLRRRTSHSPAGSHTMYPLPSARPSPCWPSSRRSPLRCLHAVMYCSQHAALLSADHTETLRGLAHCCAEPHPLAAVCFVAGMNYRQHPQRCVAWQSCKPEAIADVSPDCLPKMPPRLGPCINEGQHTVVGSAVVTR